MTRRNGFTLVEMLVVVAIVGILAAILYPTFCRSPDSAPRSRCQSNLKQIGLATMQYLQDYNDKYPLISAANQGWAEVLQPYSKSQPIFQCPEVNNATNKFSSDYFFNARVAGEKRSRISVGALTIAFGDGLDNGATNSHLSELPLDWKSDENSPAQRHSNGANYAFVDGHVKWFRPEKVTVNAAKTGNYTFAVR